MSPKINRLRLNSADSRPELNKSAWSHVTHEMIYCNLCLSWFQWLFALVATVKCQCYEVIISKIRACVKRAGWINSTALQIKTRAIQKLYAHQACDGPTVHFFLLHEYRANLHYMPNPLMRLINICHSREFIQWLITRLLYLDKIPGSSPLLSMA